MLENAIYLSPTCEKILFGASSLFYKMGIYEASIQATSKAIELAPEWQHLYVQRALAKFKSKDTDGALADCKKACELDPKDPHALVVYGRIYISISEPGLAIKHLKKALAISPDYHEAVFNLGVAHYCKYDYDNAIKEFTEYMRLISPTAEAYWHRANAYIDKSKTKTKDGLLITDPELLTLAVKDCTDALWLDPAHSKAFKLRGYANFHLENYESALKDYTSAFENKYEDKPEILKLIGYALSKLGRHEKAIDIYKEALEAARSANPANVVSQLLILKYLAKEYFYMENPDMMRKYTFENNKLAEENHIGQKHHA